MGVAVGMGVKVAVGSGVNVEVKVKVGEAGATVGVERGGADAQADIKSDEIKNAQQSFFISSSLTSIIALLPNSLLLLIFLLCENI